MYHIKDEGAAIMRIQRYLLSALAEDGISLPPIDGIYEEDTRAAVRRFQEISGLTPTGIVNEETFVLLYDKHVAAEELADTSDGANPSEILRRGDKGEEIRRLNSYLAELFADERTPIVWDGGDDYNGVTEESVLILQRKWNERQTGEANRSFIRRLIREVDARNRRTNLIYTA